MKMDKIKVLGVLSAIGGIALSLVSDYVSDKKTDKLLDDKIQKALAEKNKEG